MLQAEHPRDPDREGDARILRGGGLNAGLADRCPEQRGPQGGPGPVYRIQAGDQEDRQGAQDGNPCDRRDRQEVEEEAGHHVPGRALQRDVRGQEGGLGHPDEHTGVRGVHGVDGRGEDERGDLNERDHASDQDQRLAREERIQTCREGCGDTRLLPLPSAQRKAGGPPRGYQREDGRYHQSNC